MHRMAFATRTYAIISCMIDNTLSNRWKLAIKSPDWYMRLKSDIQRLFATTITHSASNRITREFAYDLIARLLESGRLPLGTHGPDFDQERLPVDRVVIHHTSRPPSTTLSELSAIGLLRQYATFFLANDELRGKPIWSGHFRNRAQVFFAYHWLIHLDGSATRLLDDRYIGWHAGNWQINRTSAGIALAGQLESHSPPVQQLSGLARVIREYYPDVSAESVFGHCEVAEHRTCPGSLYLTRWKSLLLELLR